MMDPWKHEDRSSSGCGRQLSSRPLRGRDYDQLSSWRYNSLMGEDRERDKHIRNGDVGRETHIEDIGKSIGKSVAKARPKQTPSSMLPSTTIPVPYHERKWMDVEPGRFDKSCLEVSKWMIILQRHNDIVPREDDGAVKFQDLASIFRSEFTSSSRWSI